MAQSKRALLYILPLGVFLILIILLYSGIGKDPTHLDSMLVGSPIPPFRKQSLFKPDQILTPKSIQGPALINIFASWCPACYREHPQMLRIAKDGVRIYGVNYKDERADALKFLKDLGNPYTKVIFDHNGRLGIDLGTYGVPETFVVDAQNRISHRHVGVVTPKAYETIIKPLLGLKAKPEKLDAATAKE